MVPGVCLGARGGDGGAGGVGGGFGVVVVCCGGGGVDGREGEGVCDLQTVVDFEAEELASYDGGEGRGGMPV